MITAKDVHFALDERTVSIREIPDTATFEAVTAPLVVSLS